MVWPWSSPCGARCWRSKGTPPAILDKLETAFKTLSEDQSFRALIKSLGDEVRFHGGKEFEKTWRDEWEQHARIVAHAK
jgi:tripartite-type tricarboxylate transporter receptor subunit TctC